MTTNDWRTAQPDPRLDTSQPNGWLYIQWHHGTDSRKDDLPEGGWEIEQARYPGLALPLHTGGVLHGGGRLITAWTTESLTIAVLATRTTWYIGKGKEAKEIPAYQPGAWSKLHILAWVGDVGRLAVLTMHASASQALANQLRTYANTILALAKRSVPTLPPSAFWLTIRPGPPQKRGRPGETSVVTPPTIDLPADDSQIQDWMDNNFVGQDNLDKFAKLLPEITRFRQPKTAPNDPLEPTQDEAEDDVEPPDDLGPVVSSEFAAARDAFLTWIASTGLQNNPPVVRIVTGALAQGTIEALEAARKTIQAGIDRANRK